MHGSVGYFALQGCRGLANYDLRNQEAMSMRIVVSWDRKADSMTVGISGGSMTLELLLGTPNLVTNTYQSFREMRVFVVCTIGANYLLILCFFISSEHPRNLRKFIGSRFLSRTPKTTTRLFLNRSQCFGRMRSSNSCGGKWA